ncbi:hypothetical protein K8352_08835 [Flavobacteriaceae bacterium F89]|uniref:Uncharacterized protein n=1 Tax=Cerina litoralis TaxID=2874477 RepID=A0AAE3EW88_9FLAO|nr:hypothetical protein [Cerina litoralis]MCG2460852.1 hypothetical protein [Cerina litoralis]
MRNSNLKDEISMEIEDMISQSCTGQKINTRAKNLHIAILKKYYNATDVNIDYHRKRVELDIVMDDTVYDPKKVNLYIPTLHTNLLFKNLCDFLKSCIDRDNKSLAFYSKLLRTFKKKESVYTLA